MYHPLSYAASLPAVRFTLCFAAGIAIGDLLLPSSSRLVLPVLACAAAILALLLIRHDGPALRLSRSLLVYALVSLAGVFAGAVASETVDTALLRFADRKERVLVEGVVDEHPAMARDRMSFRLHVRTVTMGGRTWKVDGRTLTYYSKSAFDPSDTLLVVRRGDTVIAEGALRSARPERNPNGFDARLWLRRQGLTTTLGISAGSRLRVIVPDDGADLVHAVITAARDYVRSGIRALYRGDRADIMEGLLLGERGRIQDDVLEAFRSAGTIHILAVSGLHVGIVLAIIWLPLGRIPYLIRAPLAIAALAAYAALTGGAPPVVRAVLMASVFLLGPGLQRLGHSMNSLAVAAAVILAVHPQALFQPGFQLSFAAVFALLWLHPMFSRGVERRWPKLADMPAVRSVLSLLLLTAAAQAGTLPILAAYFGQFSLVSFAANIAAVPLAFVTVAAGFPAVLLNGVAPFPAVQLAAASDAALALILWSSTALASLPGAVIAIPALPWWAVVLYAAGLLWVFGRRERIRYRAAVALAALAAVLVIAPLADGSDRVPRLRVTFLDVGQGDATLLEFPNGAAMLIDAGAANETYDAGERIVVPALRARGIHRLDALVLTHPDNDHIGGAATVLRMLEVHRVYTAWRWPGDADDRLVDSLMRVEGAQLTDLRDGTVIDLDRDVRIAALWPPREDHGESASNYSSIVLRVQYGATSFLFTGDADHQAERRILQRYGALIRSDVLKAGHHGSRGSSAPEFVAAVRPRMAVVSCGRLNRFNHPAKDVLERFRNAGIDVLRTDIGGAVQLESDAVRIREVPWR